MTDDLSKQVLESEVARLQARNAELEALLTRPVSVTVQSAEASALNQVVQYLPQLTMIATNLSYVASNIQNVNAAIHAQGKALADIADTLEGAQVIKMPADRKAPKNGPRSSKSWELS